MALRTVQGSANQKGKPAFLHFETPTKDQLKPDTINLDFNKIMQNIGSEAFAYETFKVAHDTDPRVKGMVSNFSAEGVELKTDQDAEEPATSADEGGDKVSQMAKRATDVGADL